MHNETLDAIRGLIRSELRRGGLRPPLPPGPGVWRWCDERDEWIPLLGPEPTTTTMQ